MLPSRRAALTAAILLAGGFIALRVVYRVIFGGADGGGSVLLDLPPLRLSGPFEHITLFGEITTGGLASAALSAVPFALLVLALGLIAAIIDLRALLVRGTTRGPMRTIARALVVAIATVPALVDAVRRVRIARELRGERGIASLFVPVLEHTVEQAIALGASMEVRGFAATRRVEPVCERPARLSEVSLGYDGAWVVAGIDLDLRPGTLTLLVGPTGSGKSTLLDALSGLFQHLNAGDQGGDVEVVGHPRTAVPPRETASAVGVVAQNVRASFVAATVADELGFALSVRGVAEPIVRARIVEIAGRLQLTALLDRDIRALSAGQACLVAIGAALMQHPVLLLVDEPLAELDDSARERVIDTLDRLAHEAGVCVVVAEHHLAPWGARPDRVLRVQDRALVHVTDADDPPMPDVRAAIGSLGPVVAQVTGLSARRGDRQVVHDAALSLRAGEVVALRGPNGAGKSSLLDALARSGRPETVLVDGRDLSRVRRRDRRRLVALVPERVEDLFFATTVAAECARSDRASGWAPTEGSSTIDRFVALLGSPIDRDALTARHPRDLSAGERLCLAVAIQLAVRPRVLLVDEPSRGLDASARELVGRALATAASTGTAVLIATHDSAFADSVCCRTLRMTQGRLSASAEVPR